MPEVTASVDRASIGFRSPRGPVLAALMLATGLIAIDATILATAVPSIVRELGSYQQFPWLFSVYLLAQAVSVPIYSRFADTVGRKPIILLGISLFLLGSILCGVAWSMPSLIVFRIVQGLGAGAVAPMAMTIVGDIYTVAERAKVQGYIASVWAISSVVGPALGGLFAQLDAWRWIFFVNIPLCLIAGWMLLRTYREEKQTVRHRIDYAGAVLLTIGLTGLILGMLEGGNAWAWLSLQSALCFGIGILALAGFAMVERRVDEPIVDLRLASRRLILTTTLVSLGVGALMIGVTSFAPAYLEGSIGIAPLLSGLAVAALTLGWPLAAANAGRLYLRIGFRRTTLIIDRVNGSLHMLSFGASDRSEPTTLYRYMPAETVMWEYLAEIPRMVDGSDSFAVFAHIDYAVRSWPAFTAGPFDPMQFEEGFRGAMRSIAESGRALEMNTRRLWPWIPRWWAEEGGQAVSFGSDAHEAGSLAANFPEAMAMVESFGFKPGQRPEDFWTR